MYIALIGAVIDSQHQPSSRLLSEVLNQVNQEYGNSLVLKLAMVSNNEFQGLFMQPEKVFELIDKIKFSLYPLELRFGLGVGTLSEPITQLETSDGPALWYARKAITLVKEENASQLSRIKLSAGGDGSEFRLLNDSLRLCDFVETRWRNSQRELVKISLLASGHSDTIFQSELAKKLGISRQAANQRVQSSGFYQFIRMKQSISETFSGIFNGLQGK